MTSAAAHRSRRRSTYDAAAHMLIPASISPSRGSLADFAAQITCLFWFESSYMLHSVVDATSPILALTPEAKPTTAFRKWVASILSTTQVSANVVVLALLFIFRLKKLNPKVNGNPGSEYRLLTVALMLGNKYLDDNTYTNKTWSEVSGIPVHEIHIMEVEFLSNMRYLLYTGTQEWDEWHLKLQRVHAFFNRQQPPPSKPHLPSIHIPPLLPSPPSSNHASPPLLASHSPASILTKNMGAQPSSYLPLPSPTELSVIPRKRSLDNAEMSQPKRVTRSMVGSRSLNNPFMGMRPNSMSSFPHTQTDYRFTPPLSYHNALGQTSGSIYQYVDSTGLPPPGRSIATAFGPSGSISRGQSNAPMVSTPTSTRTMTPNYNISPFHNSPFNTSSRPPSLYAGSPASISSGHSGFFTPFNTASPSFYLTSRDSPYRPVRKVSTLLAPPGSQPAAMVSVPQMQYLPLAKKPDFRQGLLPYDAMASPLYQQQQQQ